METSTSTEAMDTTSVNCVESPMESTQPATTSGSADSEDPLSLTDDQCYDTPTDAILMCSTPDEPSAAEGSLLHQALLSSPTEIDQPPPLEKSSVTESESSSSTDNTKASKSASTSEENKNEPKLTIWEIFLMQSIVGGEVERKTLNHFFSLFSYAVHQFRRNGFSLDMDSLVQVAQEILADMKVECSCKDDPVPWYQLVQLVFLEKPSLINLRPRCSGAPSGGGQYVFSSDDTDPFTKSILSALKSPKYSVFFVDTIEVDDKRSGLPGSSVEGRRNLGRMLGMADVCISSVCCVSTAGLVLLPQLFTHPLEAEVSKDQFLEWLQTFISVAKPSQNNPCILVVDGRRKFLHTSKIWTICTQSHISLLSIPTSGLANPLKVYMQRKILERLSYLLSVQSQDTLTFKSVTELFQLVFYETATTDVVVKSFELCGLHPFDRTKMSENSPVNEACFDQFRLRVRTHNVLLPKNELSSLVMRHQRKLAVKPNFQVRRRKASSKPLESNGVRMSPFAYRTKNREMSGNNPQIALFPVGGASEKPRPLTADDVSTITTNFHVQKADLAGNVGEIIEASLDSSVPKTVTVNCSSLSISEPPKCGESSSGTAVLETTICRNDSKSENKDVSTEKRISFLVIRVPTSVSKVKKINLISESKQIASGKMGEKLGDSFPPPEVTTSSFSEPSSTLAHQLSSEEDQKLFSNVVIEPSANVVIEPSANVVIEPSANVVIEPSANVVTEPSFNGAQKSSSNVGQKPIFNVVPKPSSSVTTKPSFIVVTRPSPSVVTKPSFNGAQKLSSKEVTKPSINIVRVPFFNLVTKPSTNVLQKQSSEMLHKPSPVMVVKPFVMTTSTAAAAQRTTTTKCDPKMTKALDEDPLALRSETKFITDSRPPKDDTTVTASRTQSVSSISAEFLPWDGVQVSEGGLEKKIFSNPAKMGLKDSDNMKISTSKTPFLNSSNEKQMVKAESVSFKDFTSMDNGSRQKEIISPTTSNSDLSTFAVFIPSMNRSSATPLGVPFPSTSSAHGSSSMSSTPTSNVSSSRLTSGLVPRFRSSVASRPLTLAPRSLTSIAKSLNFAPDSFNSSPRSPTVVPVSPTSTDLRSTVLTSSVFPGFKSGSAIVPRMPSAKSLQLSKKTYELLPPHRISPNQSSFVSPADEDTKFTENQIFLRSPTNGRTSPPFETLRNVRAPRFEQSSLAPKVDQKLLVPEVDQTPLALQLYMIPFVSKADQTSLNSEVNLPPLVPEAVPQRVPSPEGETECLVCGDTIEEAWIQCMGCREWVHEMCADLSHSQTYFCDFCEVKNGEKPKMVRSRRSLADKHVSEMASSGKDDGVSMKDEELGNAKRKMTDKEAIVKTPARKRQKKAPRLGMPRKRSRNKYSQDMVRKISLSLNDLNKKQTSTSKPSDAVFLGRKKVRLSQDGKSFMVVTDGISKNQYGNSVGNHNQGGRNLDPILSEQNEAVISPTDSSSRKRIKYTESPPNDPEKLILSTFAVDTSDDEEKCDFGVILSAESIDPSVYESLVDSGSLSCEGSVTGERENFVEKSVFLPGEMNAPIQPKDPLMVSEEDLVEIAENSSVSMAE